MALPLFLRKKLGKNNKKLPKALEQVYKELDKKSKYGNKRSSCLYGHMHDSRKEAMWCVKLHELEKEGSISLLVKEPVILIQVNGINICRHLPDFMFFDQKRRMQCIVDVKGEWQGGQLAEWQLKRKLCGALYPHIDYQVV